MREVIKRYWQVAIFKETPANTPHSFFLLIIFLIVYLCSIIAQWLIVPQHQTIRFIVLFLAGLLLITSYWLYIFFILKIYDKTNRLVQTLTTIVACTLIVHVLAFPLMYAGPLLLNSKLDQVLTLLLAIIYLFLTIIFSIWQFLVTAHIFKEALESDWMTSVLVSFGLLAFNILAVSYIQ